MTPLSHPIACIVQAQAEAAPLNSGALTALGDLPVLAHVLHRCQAIPGVDHVICIGPNQDSGGGVAEIAARLQITLVSDTGRDMLARYRVAAEAVHARLVIRVTSDCPLLDPEICGAVLALLADEEADYAANNMPPSWPHGLDCEAFTIDALEEADEIATDPRDRAGVTPWIRRNRSFRRVNLKGPGGELAEQRWLVNSPEDLAFLRALYARLPERKPYPGWRDIAQLVAREPALAPVNDTSRQR